MKMGSNGKILYGLLKVRIDLPEESSDSKKVQMWRAKSLNGLFLKSLLG